MPISNPVILISIIDHHSVSFASSSSTCGMDQDKAFVPDQKYKEGKFILEKNLLCDV